MHLGHSVIFKFTRFCVVKTHQSVVAISRESTGQHGEKIKLIKRSIVSWYHFKKIFYFNTYLINFLIVFMSLMYDMLTLDDFNLFFYDNVKKKFSIKYFFLFGNLDWKITISNLVYFSICFCWVLLSNAKQLEDVVSFATLSCAICGIFPNSERPKEYTRHYWRNNERRLCQYFSRFIK